MALTSKKFVWWEPVSEALGLGDIIRLLNQRRVPLETSEQVVQIAKVRLTPEQIVALGDTGVEIIPAPGAGKFIHILSSYLKYNAAEREYNLYADSAWLFGLVWESDKDSGSTDFAQTVFDVTSIHTNDGNNPYYFFPLALAQGEGSDQGGGNYYRYQPADQAENQGVFITAVGDPEYEGGALTGADINDGGSGYAIGDTFDIADGVGGTGVVDSVSGGMVTAFTITNGGTRYTLPGANAPSGSYDDGPHATTATSGGGTGLTLDFTSIEGDPDGHGTIDVVVSYVEVDMTVGF